MRCIVLIGKYLISHGLLMELTGALLMNLNLNLDKEQTGKNYRSKHRR